MVTIESAVSRPDIIPVNYPVLPSNWQSVNPVRMGFT